jgi:nucleoside-diphosphate-sugar epimerase
VENLNILITGASGWIGQETLCAIQKQFGTLSGLNLTLAGSRSRIIDIHGESVEIVRLDELSTTQNYDLIFHFAYLTQEKIRSIGLDDYLRANLEIIQVATELAEHNPSALHLVLSSGVASFLQKSNFDETNVYAKLKLELENRFTNHRALTLRLWNTSGHHLGINPNYALSEFIVAAKRRVDIQIRNNVWRTYVDAQAIIIGAIDYLLDGGRGVHNSGGIKTNLENLAQQVIDITQSSSRLSLLNSKEMAIDYVSPDTEIPSCYFSKQLDIEFQVRETSKGVS